MGQASSAQGGGSLPPAHPSFRVVQWVVADGGDAIARCDFYLDRNEMPPVDYMLNVFRLNPAGEVVWRLSVPAPEGLGTHYADRITYIERDGARLLATSFQGFVYEVDWETGEGRLVDYAR